MKKKSSPSSSERAESAFRSGIVDYHAMMTAVFPHERYPTLYRYSHNGGPPIAAMLLAKALKAVGLARYPYNNTIYRTSKSK